MPAPEPEPAGPSDGSPPPAGPRPSVAAEFPLLTEAECKRGMFWAVLVSVFNMLAVACFVDKQLQLYALRLGVEQRTFGVIVFCLAWSALARLPAAGRVERRGKKRVLITEWGAGCLGALLVVLAPTLQGLAAGSLPEWADRALTYLHETNGIAVLILLIGAVAFNLLQQGGATGWFPLLQDVVPTATRGRYFGILRTTWQVATKGFLLFAAWMIAAPEGEQAEIWRYQVILGIGLFCAAARVACIVPIPEVRRPLKPAAPFLEELMVPLRDRRFRNFLVFSGVTYLAWGMIDSFRLVYLKDLHFTEGTSGLCVAFTSLGAIVALYHWGRLSDRHGSRPVFGLCLSALAVLTLAWWAARGASPLESGAALSAGFQEHPPDVETAAGKTLVLVLFFLMGVFESGMGIAQTRQVMELVPRDRQAIYFSLNTVAVMGPMGLGALIAGVFTQRFEDVAGGWFGAGLDVYQWLFAGAVFVLAFALTLNGSAARPEETATRTLLARALARIFGRRA